MSAPLQDVEECVSSPSQRLEECVIVEIPGGDETPTVRPFYMKALIQLCDFFNAYDFPILLLAFIGIAKAEPEFGAIRLAPQYTATWIAVALIFRKSPPAQSFNL